MNDTNLLRRRRIPGFNVLLPAIIAAVTASSASATLKVCNQGEVAASIAVVTNVGMSNMAFGEWRIDGWYRAEPGQCVIPVRALETNRYYLAFLQSDSDGNIGAMKVEPTQRESVRYGLKESNARFCVSYPENFQRQGGIEYLSQCPEGYQLAQFSLFINSPECTDKQGRTVSTYSTEPLCSLDLTYNITPFAQRPVVPLVEGPPVDRVAERVRELKFEEAQSVIEEFTGDIHSVIRGGAGIPDPGVLTRKLGSVGEDIDVEQIAYEIRFPLPVTLVYEHVDWPRGWAITCFSCDRETNRRLFEHVRSLEEEKSQQFLTCVYGPYDSASSSFREYRVWHEKISVTREELAAVTPRHPLLKAGTRAFDECPDSPQLLDAAGSEYQRFTNYNEEVEAEIRYQRARLAHKADPTEYPEPERTGPEANWTLGTPAIEPLDRSYIDGNLWSMDSGERNAILSRMQQWEAQNQRILRCRYGNDRLPSIVVSFWLHQYPQGLEEVLEATDKMERLRGLVGAKAIDECPPTKPEALAAGGVG